MMPKKLFKYWPLVACAIIIASFAVLKVYNYFYWPELTITVADRRLNVLVADTPEHWLKGWSGRENMGSHHGMLFRFIIRDNHGIVMRDMNFPLDIIWLDSGQIVDMAPNVSPEKGRSEDELTVYRPRLPANAVLELPAGFITEKGLKIGDTVNLGQ